MVPDFVSVLFADVVMSWRRAAIQDDPRVSPCGHAAMGRTLIGHMQTDMTNAVRVRHPGFGLYGWPGRV